MSTVGELYAFSMLLPLPKSLLKTYNLFERLHFSNIILTVAEFGMENAQAKLKTFIYDSDRAKF
jgi:hypothetical protein